jgi:hypothetical protein
MPINNQGGVVVETPSADFDQFQRTGVHRADQFALCHRFDRLRQFQFDLTNATPGATITFAAGAAGSITLTLPTASGTLALTGGGGGNSFTTMQPDAGTSPVAASSSDTLTFTSTNSTITITGNSTTKALAFVINPNLTVTTLNTGAGAVGTPSLYFNTSTTGFWAPSSTTIAVTVGGAEIGRFSGSGLSLGIASNPTSAQLYIKNTGNNDQTTIVVENPNNATAKLAVTNEGTGGSLGYYFMDGTVPYFSYGYLNSFVGIGYNVPAAAALAYRLESVQGSADTDPTLQAAGGTSHLPPTFTLRNTSNTAGNFAGVQFTGNSKNLTSGVYGFTDTQTAASEVGSLRFYTAIAGAMGERFRISGAGNLRYSGSQYTTGAGSAALGANCPATTVTAPNTWLKVEDSAGNVLYVPAWK